VGFVGSVGSTPIMANIVSREYIETLTVSLDQIKKMQRAQYAIYKQGLIDRDNNALSEELGACSTVLGFAFGAPTIVAIIGALSGLISSLGSGIVSLETLIENGFMDLAGVQYFMEDNPNYDLIQIKMSFIEYTDQNIRFVEHTGTDDGLVAVHIKNGGGWQFC